MGKRNLGDTIKRAIGIEGSTKEAILPMMAYGTANIGAASAPIVSGTHFTPYLTYIVGLSAGQMSLMANIRGIWDAIIDPFIGVFMDRTRAKIGKHRFYMMLSAVPYALAYLSRWDPLGIVRNSDSMGKIMAYYIITGLFVATFESVYTIAHGAMLPVIAPGYFERTQYNAMTYIMNAVGMMPTQLISTAIVGIRSTSEYTPALYPKLMTLIVPMSVLLALTILVSAAATKEPSSKNQVLPPLDVLQFFRELKDVFRNKAFRHYFFTFFLNLFGGSFSGNSSMYFLKDVVKSWNLRSQLQLLGGFEAVLFPFTFLISKKYGKQKTAQLTTPLLYVSTLMGLFIKAPRAGGLPWTMILLYAREILAVVGNYGYGFTTTNIFPDITDVDEMITGRRREATVTTIRSFINTMTSSFMASVSGIFLEWFGVTDGTAKTPLFKARASDLHPALNREFGIRLSNSVVPLIFLFAALRQLRKYKMTKADHELMRRLVQEKKETGTVAEITDEEKAIMESISGQKWAEMWIGCSEKREFVANPG